MRLRDLHQEIGLILAAGGIEQPRREAAALLSFILEMSLAKIYTASDQPVDDIQAEKIRQLARRRSGHEPLAYLIGKVDFFGLEFQVGPGVLIPRPDSEILVETALAACQNLKSDRLDILDACTGSGCIGISLAVRLQQDHRLGQLWLTELDPIAAACASRNLARHGLTGQSRLDLADLFPAEPLMRWDLIVANPPYIASSVIPGLMPEVRCHEPRLALDGGADGLDFYRRLISQSVGRLKPDGCLLVEHGYDQADAVAAIFQSAGCYELIPAVRDYGGQPRVSGGKMQPVALAGER